MVYEGLSENVGHLLRAAAEVPDSPVAGRRIPIRLWVAGGLVVGGGLLLVALLVVVVALSWATLG